MEKNIQIGGTYRDILLIFMAEFHTMKVLHLSLFAFCAILMITSCKKSSNDNPFGNQKIATIDETNNGGTHHYRIVYDAYNNVDSMIITGSGVYAGTAAYKIFTYLGGSWNITDQSNFSFLVETNANRQIAAKILASDSTLYFYNGSEMVRIDDYVSSAIPEHSYYNWSNGDLNDIRTSSTSDNVYGYDKSKNGQPGDAIRINEFLILGQSYVKTTHLPTSLVISSTSGETYSYTFDGEGRISMLTDVAYDKSVPSSDTTTYAYTYY